MKMSILINLSDTKVLFLTFRVFRVKNDLAINFFVFFFILKICELTDLSGTRMPTDLQDIESDTFFASVKK